MNVFLFIGSKDERIRRAVYAERRHHAASWARAQRGLDLVYAGEHSAHSDGSNLSGFVAVSAADVMNHWRVNKAKIAHVRRSDDRSLLALAEIAAIALGKGQVAEDMDWAAIGVLNVRVKEALLAAYGDEHLVEEALASRRAEIEQLLEGAS